MVANAASRSDPNAGEVKAKDKPRPAFAEASLHFWRAKSLTDSRIHTYIHVSLL
jgi:hypothetical protein